MRLGRIIGDRRRRVLRAIPRGAVCAEIGIWKGDFAERIRAMARPRELHLIDPWRFAGDPRVVMHRQPSEAAADGFADATFDWVYIDADHSYEAVRTDLCLWAPKVRPGGIVAGDDYTWRDEQGACPVQRAVDEFVTGRAPRAHAVHGNQYFIWL